MGASLKFVPATAITTVAEISETGKLSGLSLISNSPLTANMPAVTISTAIPIIKIHQPIFDFNFCHLKSFTLRYHFLSELFSIHSPKKTNAPPMQAVNAINTSQDNQDDVRDVTVVKSFFLCQLPSNFLIQNIANGERDGENHIMV